MTNDASYSPAENTRRLMAAWGAARFVTWKSFIKYFDNRSTQYSPEAISRIDRIFQTCDVNALIEVRLEALAKGDVLEASRIKGELLAAGVELIDEMAPVSGAVTTRWDLTK